MNKLYTFFSCIECKSEIALLKKEKISFNCPECNIDLLKIGGLLSNPNIIQAKKEKKQLDIKCISYPQKKIKEIDEYESLDEILEYLKKETDNFNSVSINKFEFINFFNKNIKLKKMKIDLISFMDLKLKNIESIFLMFYIRKNSSVFLLSDLMNYFEDNNDTTNFDVLVDIKTINNNEFERIDLIF